MIKPINLSPSFLSKVYSKGYDYAVAEKLGLIAKVPTQAMLDGRLIHAMIDEKISDNKANFVVSPYDSFRTKEAKDWRDSQPDNMIVITEEKAEKFNRIIDRLVDHPFISRLLDNPCMTEMVREKQINGHNIKGILDLVSSDNDSKTIIDWKFVSSQVFDSFEKKALYENYDLQAAVYDFLEEPTNVYFCAIENEEPHRIRLFHCDESFLDSGSEKFNKSFKILDDAKWRDPNFNIDDIGELISWNHFNG